ncbi:sporulation protein [Pontibacter sp. 172403-2]|uniref:sporulation protein n=1 Tax=Pontibacter rufus TaxID=2791028 RepID=UPI0018AFC558|nr:sporulation protein [Pontibacter sp. 172403-2]MBF9251940.1 sporulation protein [Pontibacter sp. 172403-2]
MNNNLTSIFLSLLLLFTVACASSAGRAGSETNIGKGNDAKAKVKEDLSQYRPRYTVAEAGEAAKATPTHHVNDQVAVLMDTVANVNKNIRYAQGYRILAYTGSERQAVMNLRKNIIGRVPDEKDYLTYQQPNFRLKIGDFFSRVEAQQVLNQIQDLVPNAQIVPDQITINKHY